MTGTTKQRRKTRRKGTPPALTLWSATIASTKDLLTGIQFATVAPSRERVAEAEEEIRGRLEALATPVRPEAFARSIT